MRLILLSSFFAYLISLPTLKKEEVFLKNCLYPTITVINKTKESTGTGVCVQSHKISNNLYFNVLLSCEHVVSPKLILAEHIYENKFYTDKMYMHEAITLDKSKESDISIIVFISQKKMHNADVDFDANLKLKDEVFLIGCGLSGPPRFSDGKITEIGPSKINTNQIRTTVCMVPGDSGGPLYNKENKLIGIANSIKTLEHRGINHPIPAISYFKSIKLFDKLYNKPEYDFVFGKQKCPPIIIDYLWLSDIKYAR